MSTRSLIGRVDGDQIEGLYHHSDGYPCGIGCYLWRLREKVYGGDVQAMLDDLFAHPAGWSHIFPYSGYSRGAAGVLSGDRELIGPECYCHGGKGLGLRNEPPDIRTAYPGSDCWDLEWAYGLSERGMFVMTSGRADGYDENNFDTWKWTWSPVGFFPWDDGEPDWWELGGTDKSSQYYGETWVDAAEMCRIAPGQVAV